ncbi:hypothetical protein DFJ74DRAFT_709955 [Hyaloraphidium curvatum]|nr:hypothetical protein DFJ74DRAFT_709955 [Hyaloraphidium curvatum]
MASSSASVVKGTVGPGPLVVSVPILYGIAFAIVRNLGSHLAAPSLAVARRYFPDSISAGIIFIYFLFTFIIVTTVVSVAQAAGYPGGRDNKNPRTQSDHQGAQLSPSIRRIAGIRENALEVVSLFVVAALSSEGRVAEQERQKYLAIYLTVRVAYALAYVADIDLVRSLLFMTGQVSMLFLLYRATGKAL